VRTDTTDVSTGAESTATLTAEGWIATCARQPENALRFDCDLALDAPGDASIHFQAEDGDRRTRTSTAGLTTTHTITLWGMRPETAYSWTVEVNGVEGPSGTLLTGPLPASLTGLAITATGTDPVADHLAYAGSCGGQGHALIIGSDGAVYWYQPFEGRGTALNLTDDGTVILLSGQRILEYDLSGELLLSLDEDDFGAPIHHDVFKYADHVYVLFADAYPVGDEEAVVDGIYVFDRAGTLVETWELFDHLSLTAEDLMGADDRFWEEDFPGAADFSHGNSVFVDASGIYVSTRWISTIWKVVGLGEPDFGAIAWSLTGEASAPVPPDLVLGTRIGGEADFIGQHHATMAPDGRLTLFDNRTAGDTSRGLALDVDETAGTAEIVAAYPLPVQCNVQGGSFQVEGGGTVVTCATTGRTYHFQPGAAEASFTLTASCEDGGGGPGGGGPGGGRPVTARMQPIAL